MKRSGSEIANRKSQTANRQSSLPLVLALAVSLAGMALAGEKGPREGKEWKGARERTAPGPSEGRAPAKRPGDPAEDEFAARRLLKRAQDLLLAREAERAVKMLESIIEQNPKSPIRYEAYLTLGKHYIEARDEASAVNCLRHLSELKKGDQEPTGAALEMYLEGLYLTGIAHFQTRQYAAAFPILRKITNSYPNTVWANQSYYYIGMCHFAQGNWNKAIQALSLVGTFVDPNSPSIEYAEAGRRFFVKVEDADLPVLARLGKQVEVLLTTAGGDKETVTCTPLAQDQGIFICSIPTDPAPPKPSDGTLQVLGGDTITASYTDETAKDGQKAVLRQKKVKVVSTATLAFTLGSYEARSHAAFVGQPLFLLLQDLDQDTSPKADTVAVKVVSRYREALDEAAATVEPAAPTPTNGQEQPPDEAAQTRAVVRDEVTVTLTELPGTSGAQAAIRTGRFGGSVRVEAPREGQPPDKADQVLTCALGDEIVASYVDALHIGGAAPREVAATLKVVGDLDSRPRATQNVVPDPILRTKRDLVEATAYLELAKIFKSMGLSKGAKEKSDEGLERTDAILRIDSPMPSALREEAFKLKWELHLAQDDFPRALSTCQLFNRLYPDSPFVDQALMGIATIKLENGEHEEAMKVFRQVLALPHSQAKAEAQFRIAQAIEAGGPQKLEAAIQQYKLCADRFPESAFAGPSLAKLVDYEVETKNYARADDLLTQIFQDYPDGDFLDSMLLKWVIVAYRLGDYQKAYNKCSQLLFEYPASPHAKKAKDLLPKIEAKVKGKDEPTEDRQEE